MSVSATNPGRFVEIDVIRGLALILMLVYHLVYDLVYFNYLNINNACISTMTPVK